MIFDLDRVRRIAVIEPFAMPAMETQTVHRLPGGAAGLPCDARGLPV